jgi:hypothetical protein
MPRIGRNVRYARLFGISMIIIASLGSTDHRDAFSDPAG